MGAVGGDGDGLMQGLSGGEEKVLVSIRLRPLNDKERARNDVSEWECVSNNTVIYRNSLSVSERSMYPTGYSFDRVFSCDCSTRQVYDEGAKDVALSVVAGINASIFAYGQTSSGKTYTMSGITEYTVADIYDYLRKHNEREFIMKFSAMEIYNESVRDLLSTDSTPLRLLDDPERGTIVEKLTDETLRDWNHFRELLSICEDQRQIGETSLNEASSRSHQILRLTIESSSREFKGNDKASSLSATVNFIDLAGSERASQTLSAGTRLKEGCHINRSLLTLGTVIRKLSKGRNGHVPYRDSKLTRILQSSLGGNARTAIICTLSPTRSHVEQSRNTLLFASCAKEVATNAQVNVVISDKALVKKLQRELARLENEIRCPGTITVSPDYSALLREKELQIEKLKKELSEVTLQRDAAQSQVKDLLRAAEEDKASESVNLDQYYPKLRVRSSWDFEHQAPRALVLPLSQRVDSNRRSFDTSQNSDRQSSNSDENYYQIQDFDENSVPTDSSSPRFPVRIPNFVEIDCHQEESKEYGDDNSDDVCKEVRCIEVEESATNRHIKTNISDSSPKRSFSSNVPSPVAKEDISDLSLVENAASPNEAPGTPYFKKSENPNSFPPVFRISSPEKPYQWLLERDFSGSTCLKITRSRSCRISPTANFYSRLFERENDENTPSTILDRSFIGRPDVVPKQVPALRYGADIEPLSINESRERLHRSDLLENFSNGDSQEGSTKIDHREKFSRNGSEENLSRSSSQEKLSRYGSWEVLSRSGSREKLLRDGSPENSSKIHRQEAKLPRDESQENSSKIHSQEEKLSRDCSREIPSKSDSQEGKLPKYASQEISYKSDSQDKLSRDVSLEKFSRSGSLEKLSRSCSQGSAMSEAIDELKTIDVTPSNGNRTTNTVHSADVKGEPISFPSERLLADFEVSPCKSFCDFEVSKTEEDLVEATRTVKDIGLDPIRISMESPQWPSEFKRLQREIIELWHACNVSLVHRTYFLLLFRGDPTDSIYMEVELRRLSFIKDTFSRGNQTMEDGRTLTYASSLRSLFRERLMLSKQMKKKLSKHERRNIYIKWGIGLNTRHRRLQLAHRLWADTKDMGRITESSAIVVKLVSSGEPEQASKEMFGLRFTPRRTSRKYYGLAQGVVNSFL